MGLVDQISGGAYINKLPDIILLQVLKYLQVTDRCRARRVCQHWNRILSDNSLWRHVDLLEFQSDLRTLWKIIRTNFSPCLTSLKIRGCVQADGRAKRRASLSDPILRELTARCPNLRKLHLIDSTVSNFSFESLPPSITCLEMVSTIWQPRWMRNKQKRLPYLQHLTLDNSLLVDGYDLIDIAAWKKLKHLSLVGCYRITTIGIKSIASRLSELEFLDLSSTDIHDLAVHYIAQQLKKMKELCLAKCTFVNDGAVASIAVGLPVLKKLNISYCERVTMSGLESLFVSNLSVLIVERETSLSEEEKQTLKKGFPKNFVLRA